MSPPQRLGEEGWVPELRVSILVEHRNRMGSVKNPSVQAAFQINLRVRTQRWNSLSPTRDGGAWWAAVCGVAQSWTRLKRLSSSSRDRCAVPRASLSLSGEEVSGAPCWREEPHSPSLVGFAGRLGVSATWGRRWSRLCKLCSRLPFHS